MYFSARCESRPANLYQKVQRVLAAVEVSGFPRFGERRVPIGRCEFETVSAQVGQLDVYPFPADGIVCLG